MAVIGGLGIDGVELLVLIDDISLVLIEVLSRLLVAFLIKTLSASKLVVGLGGLVVEVGELVGGRDQSGDGGLVVSLGLLERVHLFLSGGGHVVNIDPVLLLRLPGVGDVLCQ